MPTALRLEDYGDEEDGEFTFEFIARGSWVTLEPPLEDGEGGAPAAAPEAAM